MTEQSAVAKVSQEKQTFAEDVRSMQKWRRKCQVVAVHLLQKIQMFVVNAKNMQEYKMEQEIIWKGYLDEIRREKYEIEIPEEKFDELWEKFKQWEGSQEEFYFIFVNPFKLLEPRKFLYTKGK